MHRTQTLDYSVLLEGEMELMLDGGEVRVVRKGDVVVAEGADAFLAEFVWDGGRRGLWLFLWELWRMGRKEGAGTGSERGSWRRR
jgi:hypothetical protein